MANLYIGDLIQAGKLANEIYELAYSENLSVDRLRRDFINNIKSSADGVDRIAIVFDDTLVRSRAELRDLNEDLYGESYTTSLYEIVGDYKSTIHECEQLVKHSEYFARRSGAFNQWRYNATVQKDVERLSGRLELFTTKMTFLIKPLEIDLLNRIFRTVSSIEAVVRRIEHLILNGASAQSVPPVTRRQPTLLQIPEEIRRAFEEHAKSVRDTCFCDGMISVPQATDAIALHLRTSTRARPVDSDLPLRDRMPLKSQYLSLLKCVWVLEQVEDQYDFSDHESSSHWPSYYYHLSNEVSRQCRRFLPARYADADLVVPPDLRPTDSECVIWTIPEAAPILPRVNEDVGMMEEIGRLKNVLLEPSEPGATLKMRLFRGDKDIFQILFVAQKPAKSPETSTFMFSAKTAQLIAHYAHPSQEQIFRFEIINNTNRVSFVFKSKKDALVFQQAVTSYKVYYSHGPVDVSLANAGSDLVLGRATLQLWRPRELEGAVASAEDVEADLRKIDAPSSPTRAAPMLPRRQHGPESPTFGAVFPSLNGMTRQSSTLRRSISSPASSLLSPSAASFASSQTARTGRQGDDATSSHRRDSVQTPSTFFSGAWHMRRKSKTNSSSSHGSLSSVGARTVTVVDHGSNFGLLHTKPKKPLLVLLLETTKNSASNCLSIITIQIDERTRISHERCACRERRPDICDITFIECGKGTSDKARFLAHAYAQKSHLGFDVGQLGSKRREELPANQLSTLYRVGIRFQPRAEKSASTLRQEFGGYLCSCRLRTPADVERCRRADPPHRGSFGEIRDISIREHAGYINAQHNRPDIVVGPES